MSAQTPREDVGPVALEMASACPQHVQEPSSAPEGLSCVQTAIILAAGNGSRLQPRSGAVVSKPLLRVGGAYLLERTILTLRAAGVERFRVVVGFEHERVVSALSQLKRLAGLAIEWVYCDRYALGNGVSLAAGAAEVTEPFLVAMADHVTTVGTVDAFVRRALTRPNLPQLSVDPDPASVFDLDDATKVATRRGRIVAIGKELSDYDAVDTGLFYFPAGFGQRVGEHVAQGARSVSDVITEASRSRPFLAVGVQGAVWQDVDTPAMAREAERRLLKTLVRPTDGLVSRLVNRPVSLAISRYLAHWGVSPNAITTVVTLLALVAAPMVATANALWVAAGGILFQITSILGGCDGEVSRLTLRGSRFGGWYDVISDNIRYGAFFVCLGLGSYHASEDLFYLWVTAFFAIVMTFTYATLGRYVSRTSALPAALWDHEPLEAGASLQQPGWRRRLGSFLAAMFSQDAVALLAMLLCVAGLPLVMFWIGVVWILLKAGSVLRSALGDERLRSETRAGLFTALALMAGLGILGLLVSRVPVGLVTEALGEAGFGVLVVFAVAPSWFAANALSLAALVGSRVPLLGLLANQLAGEGINAIVPLAGVAGEPYKIRHLAQWLPPAEAGRAIVFDRLIHAVAALSFAGALLVASVWVGAVPDSFVIPLALVGVGLMAVAAAVAAFTLSRAPGRLVLFLAGRFEFLGGLRRVSAQLPRAVFVNALACKIGGRVLNLLEVWLLFVVLGQQPSVAGVLLCSAFINAANLLGSIFPQGIGVAEAGIAGAFVLLGLPAHLGLTFGLIRRARVVVWAIAGAALLVPIELHRWLPRHMARVKPASM